MYRCWNCLGQPLVYSFVARLNVALVTQCDQRHNVTFCATHTPVTLNALKTSVAQQWACAATQTPSYTRMPVGCPVANTAAAHSSSQQTTYDTLLAAHIRTIQNHPFPPNTPTPIDVHNPPSASKHPKTTCLIKRPLAAPRLVRPSTDTAT